MMGGVPCQRGELFQTPENAWKGGGSIIAANSGGGEIGGLVLVPTRGEPVDRRATCSGDHTLCGQGLRSLRDGHQIVGSNGPSIAVLSPIWTWCLCRYQTRRRGSMAAPLRPKAGMAVNRVDSFLPFSFHLVWFLRVGYERFHVIVEKKKRGPDCFESEALPCFTQFSAKPMDPACLAQNSINVSAFCS